MLGDFLIHIFQKIFKKNSSETKTSNSFKVKVPILDSFNKDSHEIQNSIKVPTIDNLLDFRDRPYSLGFVNDEYLAIGNYSNEELLNEPGLATTNNGNSEVSHISLEKVLDLTNEHNLESLNITKEILVNKPYNKHGMTSHIARTNGYQGMIVPSPRIHNGKILILFQKAKT